MNPNSRRLDRPRRTSYALYHQWRIAAMADLGDVGKARSGAIGVNLDRPPHIADQLIAERGQRIVNSRFWPLLRPLLHKILHYREAVRMADDLAPLPGHAAMDYMSRLLALDLDVRGLEHVPASGSIIIAANHPTGIADGVAIYDALQARAAGHRDLRQPRRDPDQSAFLGVPHPVEWRRRSATAEDEETLKVSSRAFREAGRSSCSLPAASPSGRTAGSTSGPGRAQR